jgi:hypothetical protein
MKTAAVASEEAVSHEHAKKNHRHILVVDRGFQYRYSLLLVGAGALIGLLCGGLMLLAHQQALADIELTPELQAELASRRVGLYFLLVAVSVLIPLGLGLVGLLVTHRIAGPVYAMSRYMSELAQGHYPTMRPLRKGDELNEMFELFHRAVDFMKAREVEEAFKLEEAILALKPHAQSTEAKAALEGLQRIHDRKREATSRNS